MGLAQSAVKLLLNENKNRPFNGRVLTLGRQDVLLTSKALQKLCSPYQIVLPESIELSHKAEFRNKEYISDKWFFKCLGFQESVSLDYSDYELADYIFDLNSDSVPKELQGAFDVIIDSGTLEHVFHVPNVLKNIFQMLKVGGRVIHIAPSSNHIDHGFYMFSPTLFWDFYEANAFVINTIQLIQYEPDHQSHSWKLSDYYPGCINNVSYGGLDSSMYAIYSIATKQEISTGHVIPQQSNYSRSLWLPSQHSTESLIHKCKSLLKKIAILHYILRPIVKLFRSKGLGLKVVKRL